MGHLGPVLNLWAQLNRRRVITKSDVPRLGDRVKEVLVSDSQHRSGWEITVYVISLALLLTASSIIWNLSSGIALKLGASVVALLLIGSVSTAILVKLRFRN